MSISVREAGTLTGYRGRVYDIIRSSLTPLGRINTALDVGAGEGWYAHQLVEDHVIERVDAVETFRRKHVIVEPILYDGRTLPARDRAYDLVYAIDVIHHADDPLSLLQELARASNQWILLKDHTWSTGIGRFTLALLDELGNRRFGIPSPGHYQQKWAWVEFLRTLGFEKRSLSYPAVCQRGLLGALTNSLQFVAVFERRHED